MSTSNVSFRLWRGSVGELKSGRLDKEPVVDLNERNAADAEEDQLVPLDTFPFNVGAASLTPVAKMPADWNGFAG